MAPKVRGQITTTQGIYKGLWDGLRSIKRKDGYRGLYKVIAVACGDVDREFVCVGRVCMRPTAGPFHVRFCCVMLFALVEFFHVPADYGVQFFVYDRWIDAFIALLSSFCLLTHGPAVSVHLPFAVSLYRVQFEKDVQKTIPE